MLVIIAWVSPFIMVSLCMLIGDPETLFTSPNQLETENVIYINLKVNNSLFRGNVKP